MDLGYPDQALQKVHEALTLAQELAHPFSLAWALVCAAIIHQYRREGRLAQEQAEATITLCADQGFALWLAGGTLCGAGRWRTGTERRGDCPNPPEHKRLLGYRS